MERLVVYVPLAAGAEGAIARLLAGGPPFDPAAIGAVTHTVHVEPGLAVFVFDGEGLREGLDRLAGDADTVAAFAAWGPALAGAPTVVRERYRWERPRSDAAPRVETERAFRSLNEALERAVAGRHGRARRTYVCECSDPFCRETVELPPEEYAAIRRRDRFVAVSGHEDERVDIVVEAQEGRVVLAKAPSELFLG